MSVFDPAVIRHQNEVVLLLRVAEASARMSESDIAAPTYNPHSGNLEVKQ